MCTWTCSIQAEFANPSLVTAHKLLLRAALEDERNSMFVLVSEACIPLHHPALFWAQLIAESHVSRAADGGYSMYRWLHRMTTNHLHIQNFKKGNQWLNQTYCKQKKRGG